MSDEECSEKPCEVSNELGDTSHVPVLDETKIGEENSQLKECVYHELARINGKINKFNRNQLINKLKTYNLDIHGTDGVLRKRLKNNYKLIKFLNIGEYLSKELLPFYVIIDFEATCEVVNPPDYEHEIIEFPAVLVSTKTQSITDTFQYYCKPVLKPKLTEFCTELTGITQEQVENSEEFPIVLKEFEKWLEKHGLGSTHKFAIATDGPWDMSRFLYRQCIISNITYPQWGKKWVNIRKIFANFYKCQRCALKDMLEHLKLPLEGRLHCGLDDAKNIARILIQLMCDGANVQINERINIFKKNTEENKNKDGKSEGKKVENVPGWGNWSNQKLVGASVKPVQINQQLKTIQDVRKERNLKEHATAINLPKTEEVIEKVNQLCISSGFNVIKIEDEKDENEDDSYVTGEGWQVARTRHGQKPKKKNKKRY